MLLVVGLGNPGVQYERTRHNVGFRVVDQLAQRMGAQFKEQFSGQSARIQLEGSTVLLLKPMTFMNRSGESVRKAAQFYKVLPKSLWVVHDELDLPYGEVRLKIGGGEAGHNGLRSISQHLGRDYGRIRIGIDRPPKEFSGDAASYVLRAFSPDEATRLDEIVERATRAVELLARNGAERAMNEVNRRQPQTKLLAPEKANGSLEDQKEPS